MPSKDMPLKQLKKYMGTNERPENFWEFWDGQMERVKRASAAFRSESCEIPDNEQVEYRDILTTGMAGGLLHAKLVRPRRSPGEKIPLVLQFHGYPGASRGWFEQTSFAGMGLAVLAMECPGQGGYSRDGKSREGTTASDHIIMGLDGPPEKMYYVDTFLDTCLMVKIAEQMEGIDTERIYVNGGSQGAALSLVCAALNPHRIKRCAAAYPFLSDYKRVYDMDRDMVVYDGLRYYTRWFNPDGRRTEEIFKKLGYIDVQNFVERIQCPVLFATGLMDEVCPPSTQFAVYHKIKAPKKHMIFPDYGHEEIGSFDDMLLSFLGGENPVWPE